jgi:hypothetical protein
MGCPHRTLSGKASRHDYSRRLLLNILRGYLIAPAASARVQRRPPMVGRRPAIASRRGRRGRCARPAHLGKSNGAKRSRCRYLCTAWCHDRDAPARNGGSPACLRPGGSSLRAIGHKLQAASVAECGQLDAHHRRSDHFDAIDVLDGEAVFHAQCHGALDPSHAWHPRREGFVNCGPGGILCEHVFNGPPDQMSSTSHEISR